MLLTMAWTPRRWQVLIKSLTYASMNGTVMVTALRSGNTNWELLRNFLMTLKM